MSWTTTPSGGCRSVGRTSSTRAARWHVASSLLFRCNSPAVVAAFAAADPYVTNGLVTRWRVREWTTVVGPDAAVSLAPLPPVPEAPP